MAVTWARAKRESPPSGPVAGACTDSRPAEGPGCARRLELAALVATRAAALACQPTSEAATQLRPTRPPQRRCAGSFASAPGSGVVVIGEGEKDGAPMLSTASTSATAVGPEFDVAVDPLEGTKLCARGLGGAMTTIACSAPGPMWSPGRRSTWTSWSVGARARGAIDITLPPERNLANVAEALGKRVAELRVVIPRQAPPRRAHRHRPKSWRDRDDTQRRRRRRRARFALA